MVEYSEARARDCDHSQHAEIPRDMGDYMAFVCGNCGCQVDTMAK